MSKRTAIAFQYDGDIWSIVEKWAGDTGFRLKDSSDSLRLYQKGTGFLTAPMMLQIIRRDKEIHLEAWVRVNILARIMGLFLIPSEMGIESGGLKLVAPRRIARNAVNKLLAKLGQQEIQ